MDDVSNTARPSGEVSATLREGGLPLFDLVTVGEKGLWELDRLALVLSHGSGLDEGTDIGDVGEASPLVRLIRGEAIEEGLDLRHVGVESVEGTVTESSGTEGALREGEKRVLGER